MIPSIKSTENGPVPAGGAVAAHELSSAYGTSQLGVLEVPDLPSMYGGVVQQGVADGVHEAAAALPPGETVDIASDGCTLSFLLTQDSSGAFIIGCTGRPQSITIPAEVEGMAVVGIGPRAFALCHSLRSITLPSTLQSIGDFAFMETSITSIELPSSLRSIGKKAFMRCHELTQIELPAGLESIGDGAFQKTGLAHLEIPARVCEIGMDFLAGSTVDTTLSMPVSIAAGNPCFTLDAQGCLYRITNEGLSLVQLINPDLEECIVGEGCVEIGPKSFSEHTKIRRVVLADSVVIISEKAFKKCPALEEVILGDDLLAIADSAFQETALRRLDLPASLQHIGICAIFTGSMGKCDKPTTIQEITVEEGNPTFYTNGHFLCRRIDDETSAAVAYTGHEEIVYIPPEVVIIGAHCFAGMTCVHRLVLHDRVRIIDMLGLAFKSGIREIVIRSLEEGKPAYVVHYPAGFAGENAVQMSFRSGVIDLENMYHAADHSIIYTTDKFQQGRLMCLRLVEGGFLEPAHRELFMRVLTRELPQMIREFARNGYTKGLDQLAEIGLLNEETLPQAIEIAISCAEAKATNHLLSMRRRNADAPLLDMDL